MMVIPENIGRDDVDAAALHFEKLLAPFGFRITREVKLTHDRQPRFAITEEAAAIE